MKGKLFDLQVPPEKIGKRFDFVRQDSSHEPARAVMEELFANFEDPDGNFVEQFQTTAFDQRIWELYLFACFREWGFKVNRKHDRPDFILGFDPEICVEAVTANPTEVGGIKDPIFDNPDFDAVYERYLEEAKKQKGMSLAPIKLAGALFAKLGKRYWELEHVKGKPLVLAVEGFFDVDAFEYTSTGLESYLYGVEHYVHSTDGGRADIRSRKIGELEWQGKKVPTGFFLLPNAEYISAVVFSNAGTISKFNRMGQQRKPNPKLIMVRGGLCYDHDPNALKPMAFSYTVGDGKHEETWREGLHVFHNPNALNPLADEVFPNIRHGRLHNELLISTTMPEFSPFKSMTHILRIKGN